MRYCKPLAVKKLHGAERGATLLEFSLVCGILLLGIVGFFEFALAMYTYQYVVSAAQEGARYAVVRGAHWGSDNHCASVSTFECNATNDEVEAYVKSLATNGIATSSIQVSTTWPGSNADGTADGCTDAANSPGCEVEVVVSYPYELHIPFIPNSAIPMSSTATMVIQQ